MAIDENLGRGDLKIKSGSIEVSNILSNKTKFVDSTNVDDDLKNLRNNIENNSDTPPDTKTINNNDKSEISESKKNLNPENT